MTAVAKAKTTLVVVQGQSHPLAKGLVAVEGNKIFTDSRVVADRFGKRHDNVIRAVENISKTEGMEEFSLLNFEEANWTDAQGKTRRMYRMTEDGFLLLAMGFTGPLAMKIKTDFIKAFRILAREVMHLRTQLQNESWKEARALGKHTRRELTETIQKFIEYAQSQGSTSGSWYFVLVTKAEYRALYVVDNGLPSNFRDRLSAHQLGDLRVAEQIAERALRDGMEQNLPYKKCYELAKERLETYALLLGGKSLPGGETQALL